MSDTREHILTTAFRLFLQKNFKEVTMKEIVAETGLSKGAFYHYFTSKEQVFEEVLNFFLADYIQHNFDSYSQNSLKEFFEDLIKAMERKFNSANELTGKREVTFTSNHYFLIFDGMKMLPAYRQKLLAATQEELKAWKKIVRIARKNGEIKTTGMTDEQIAKMFVYVNDGFGINKILDGTLVNFDKQKQEMLALWKGIYDLLKT